MILTHESGSQEDKFDEKKWRQKSRETIPLSGRNLLQVMNGTTFTDMRIYNTVKKLVER